MKSQDTHAQNSERLPIPKTLDYFFVAVDRQCRGYVLQDCPISPNYRTADEAEVFFKKCGVAGAKIIEAHFLITDATDLEGLEFAVFQA